MRRGEGTVEKDLEGREMEESGDNVRGCESYLNEEYRRGYEKTENERDERFSEMEEGQGVPARSNWFFLFSGAETYPLSEYRCIGCFFV